MICIYAKTSKNPPYGKLFLAAEYYCRFGRHFQYITICNLPFIQHAKNDKGGI